MDIYDVTYDNFPLKGQMQIIQVCKVIMELFKNM